MINNLNQYKYIYSGKYPQRYKIFILTKAKGLQDIAVCSDGLNLEALSKTVQKHFICYPKYR